MTANTTILAAEFPKAVRGYAPQAVDEFVHQMGVRLEAMQARLDEQTGRAERLAAELERARGELTGAGRDLTAFREKEAAIVSALVAMEQRRASIEAELDAAREAARQQSEQIVAEGHTEAENMRAQARQEVDSLLADAFRRADEAMARGEAACASQEERLQALQTAYDETVARVRRMLEAQLALLPASDAVGAAMQVAEIAVSVEPLREEQAA